MKSLLILVFFAFCFVAKGQEIDSRLNFMAAENRYSPLEPAGSRGSYGFDLGIGINNSQSQRIYLQKGLYFPINLGLSFSKLSNSENQFSAHIQWTIFEKLKWPSLALRGLYSKYISLKNEDFYSMGMDGIISLGFLRYFTIYGGYGGQLNKANLKEKETMLYGTSILRIKKTFYTSSYFYGIKITIIPAFCSLTMEYLDTLNKNYLAKISVTI